MLFIESRKGKRSSSQKLLVKGFVKLNFMGKTVKVMPIFHCLEYSLVPFF